MKPFTAALAIATVIAPVAARGDDDPGYRTGPWHFKSISCVDTTVMSVTPRLGEAGQTTFTPQDFKDSGVIVNFATGLGMQPLFPKETASITHYQDSAGNDYMEAERKGDKVQVCFLSGPAPILRCDPDRDDRGRNYRVWDYRRQHQYWGMNSEHECGGA